MFIGPKFKSDQKIKNAHRLCMNYRNPVAICIRRQIMGWNEMLPLNVMAHDLLTNVMVIINKTTNFPLTPSLHPTPQAITNSSHREGWINTTTMMPQIDLQMFSGPDRSGNISHPVYILPKTYAKLTKCACEAELGAVLLKIHLLQWETFYCNFRYRHTNPALKPPLI